MTHAEQYSTSEPSAPPPPERRPANGSFRRYRTCHLIGLRLRGDFYSTRPASADQIADARAQAAAITAKIQATQAQIQTLTGQVQSADYRLSQLTDQITASQKQMAKDQAR